jgi:hypothetical protein
VADAAREFPGSRLPSGTPLIQLTHGRSAHDTLWRVQNEVARPRVKGLNHLPSASFAVAWVDDPFPKVVGKVLRGPLVLLTVGLGLPACFAFDHPLPIVVATLAWCALLSVTLTLLTLDGANAAGPGWLASRWLFRWRWVHLDRLTAVRALPAGIWFEDADGGRALFVPRRHNSAAVLNVVRDRLLRAHHADAVSLPDELLNLLSTD